MDEWLTYKEAGDRLGVSAEAARQRAIRGRWQRRMTNEGVAVIRLPEDVNTRTNTRRTPKQTPVEQVNEHPNEAMAFELLLAALQDHVLTLKDELEYARAELAAERQAALEAIHENQRLRDELAELRNGKPAGSASSAAINRAKNLIDILARMREKREAKAA